MTIITSAKSVTGFTLIELAIVLVIIGFVVGGVLAGADMIRAAGERGTITQVEKFNQATNTFFEKFGYLPGDIPAAPAAQFGLTARGQYPGQGDGNGILEGNNNNTASGNSGQIGDNGEEGMFWVDLTTANGLNLNLIDGSFNTATILPASGPITGSALNKYYPAAKLGQGNYFYVYSRGAGQTSAANFYGLSAITTSLENITSNPGLTAKQGYDIDKKIDDGLPQTGNVTAKYLNFGSGFVSPIWAGTSTGANAPYTTATPGSATTCFDNNNVTGATQQYSITTNGGSGINCALSFKLQGGD